MEKQNKVGMRMWMFVILIGFAGQLAWSIENMYLNTYITYLNFSDPSGKGFDYSFMIALTTALSAIVATLTTIFMGALTDKIGHKKYFISIGYLLWGVSTSAFGLLNVNSSSSLIPIAMTSSMAAIWVIILDCLMTFFGSTSNDAAFNSYVTKNISDKNKGKVEGVLQILPLVAMLLIFVVLNGFTTDSSTTTHDARWDLFFYLIGGLVILMGIISFFLIPKEEEKRCEKPYISKLTEGFKISTIKKNADLYLVLIIYFIYATATQIVFPYFMVYIQYTCGIENVGTGLLTPFAIVMAIALIVGSLLSVFIGFACDKLGKNKMIIPSFIIYIVGILMMFFVPNSNNGASKNVFASISALILIIGYVSIPTVLNSSVRERIPKDYEGTFMGVRMLFVVALPMCIGPFIGDFMNSTSGKEYVNEFGNSSFYPSEYSYLVCIGVLLLAIIPIIFYLRREKKNNKNNNNGYLFSKRNDVKIDFDEIPLSDYPRPNLVRDSYLCLNGSWDFAISKSEEIPSFDKKIMVPFAVESAYSGINHLVTPDEILYYHKRVKLNDSFVKDKLIIHFEGVDQYCEVFIDGKLVKSHIGGFTPFDVELKAIKNEFDVVLKVKDYTDASYHTRGKQTLNVTGYFYSSSSGVYKPIWIESVKEKYIQNVFFTPDYDKKSVKIKVITTTDDKVKLILHNKEYELNSNVENEISLENDFHPWSNKDPYLYECEIIYFEDKIKSYFGIRKIEIKEINGKKRILLNDKPIFLSGLLDQGYYFIGNYTPKNYDEYLFDIQKSKEMGFNCLRKHIKTELPLFYYYCDKEGMLIIQDFPCGGDSYSFFWSVIPRVFPSMDEKNITYKRLARTSEEGRKEFINECFEYLDLYNNYPSILIYTIFNEGWGEFEPSKIYHLLKEKEKLKLFDTASGWYDADSDFYSIHTYTKPEMKRIDRKNRPFIISEMGGMSLKVENHSFYDGMFGHGIVKTKEELTQKYIDLFSIMKSEISSLGLNMTIYTELADCETEYNGLLTFDRKVTKIDVEVLKKINNELYQELEKVCE